MIEWSINNLAQSLNTKVDLTTEAVSYLGFSQYGKIMVGDKAIEFFDDRNVDNNMQFPWKSILRVEGEVSKSFGGKMKIGRQFAIVLLNGKKVRFSSKDSGKILKLLREQIGNDKVVKAPKFSDAFKNLLHKFGKKKKA